MRVTPRCRHQSMWALDDFGRDLGLVPHHLGCLRAEAAEDRLAGKVWSARSIRTLLGGLILTCGQVLIQSGEWLTSPPAASASVVAHFEIGGQDGLNG